MVAHVRAARRRRGAQCDGIIVRLVPLGRRRADGACLPGVAAAAAARGKAEKSERWA